MKWVICSDCHGEGHHSKNLGSFTADEMEEMGDDFYDAYRQGLMDSRCTTCGGSGKTKAGICEECKQEVEHRLSHGEYFPVSHHPCDSAEISERAYFAMMER